MKMKSKTKQKYSILRLFGILTASFCLLLTVLILVGAVYIRQKFETELPNEFFSLTAIGQSPSFYVYQFEDRQNRIGTQKELATNGFAQKKSDYISYDEIPQNLIDAFVSIEDKRFYSHSGVDWYRTLAAIGNYFFKGKKHFGASTITQQLVKNMTGNDAVSISRKAQEIFYALDLEKKLDKSQILELYLNIIHFSDHCNGIEQASKHYFDKKPGELTLAQAASIAAITNNPSYYNPIRNPENNLARRNLILSEMRNQNLISEKEYQTARSEPLGLSVTDTKEQNGINSWYIDMVIEDVINDLMKEYSLSRTAASTLVYRGGIKIDIAMDEKIQSIVEDHYENAVRTPINQSGTAAQSALIVIDSKTGDVLGVAGAVGVKNGNRIQNFATQTKRSPGSVIKPISVYAPALEEGIINWASVYDDVPCDFGTNGTQPWPKNATGVYRGLTNIPYAVAHSTNTVSVRVLNDVGLKRSFSYAKNRFHLQNLVEKDCDVAALALGQLNYGVTLREMTTAYTVFADKGAYHPYRSYYRVLSSDGKILLSNTDKSELVLSEENAAIMTKLLQGVVETGTSSSITLNKLVECAGKTGTTNADGDRWYIGYTPDLICGVWCGYEYPEPIQGRNLCTDIWNQVMTSVWKSVGGQKNFSIPTSLIRASYCKDSGKLQSEICALDPRGNRSEIGWFTEKQLPRFHCDCHVLCEYDVECQGVSHGFCPSSKQIALIRTERSFPIKIAVTDAQYTWDKSPMEYSPNFNFNQAYFENKTSGFRGISGTNKPFNASCQVHRAQSDGKSEWESLIPNFFKRIS